MPTCPFPLAQVRLHNGAPRLFLNGQPVFPLFLMTGPRALADLNRLGPCPIHLLTESFELGWTGVDTFDPAPFDEKARALLGVDPEAWLLPRLLLDAPADWLDAHPDDVTGYADPASWDDHKSWFGPRHPSWASAPWREDAGAALRRLIRHAAGQDYAARVIGWHLGSGIYGEWHWWNAVYYPDTSPAFVAAYRDWLTRKYPGQPPAPRLPTVAERREADVGLFRDPVRNRWFIDHAEFLHLVGADALAQFARIVKTETEARSLVVAFNGYLPDLGVNHEIDHRAFDVALRNPDLDAFASPHTYWRRGPGQDGIFRGFPASVRAHGKLWLDEADDRTHLAAPTQYKHVQTREEAVEVLWRSFGQALATGSGLWFMDQAGLWSQSNETGWYQDQAILDAFRQMHRIATDSLARRHHPPIPSPASCAGERQGEGAVPAAPPLRGRAESSSPELAVVCSFPAAFHLADRAAGLDHVTLPLLTTQLEQFTKSGVPFDLQLLSELGHPDAPTYQAYAFLDAFYLSESDFDRLNRLRESGKLLLFFYATGFASERGLSVKRMSSLLDLNLQQVETIRLPGGQDQRPGFVATGRPGPIARHGRVCFCPAPPLPAADLRGLLREGGLHVWIESDDVLYAGAGYVTVHASSVGPKHLRAPYPVRWTNLRTGAVLAERAGELRTTLARGETLVLAVN